MTTVGVQAGTVEAGAASAELPERPQVATRRESEPLLVSLDEIVSEIRILGGAVEASSPPRRDETAD